MSKRSVGALALIPTPQAQALAGMAEGLRLVADSLDQWAQLASPDNTAGRPIQRHYTVSEASRATGIPTSTLRDWCVKGVLPALHLDGRWRIAAADLARLHELGKERSQ